MAARIPLTQGQYALVDDDDVELVSRYKWQAHWFGDVYRATRSVREGKKIRTVMLSHVILGVPPGTRVRHINRDTLDCQKSNLKTYGRTNLHTPERRLIAAMSIFK
jgi:hypothetical protein